MHYVLITLRGSFCSMYYIFIFFKIKAVSQ